MSEPVFPTLSKDQDARQYSVELEDPSMKSEMEGGYVFSRARHTRKPRRTFSIGFTALTAADRTALENFYDSVRGGSVIFDWTDISTNTLYKVRFAEKLVFKHTGAGSTRLYDVSVKLQQA